MLDVYKSLPLSIKYFFMIFILIIFPIFGFFFFARLNTIETSLSQKKVSDSITLNTLAANLETYMKSVEVMGSLLSTNESSIQLFIDAHELAKANEKHNYENLVVPNAPSAPPISVVATSYMDASGIFIKEQTLNLNRLSYFFNATLMEEIQATNAPMWTKSFSIEFNKNQSVKKVLSLVVPVYENTDNVLGYVVLFVDTKHLSYLLEPYLDDIYILESSYIIASKNNLPPQTSLFSEMQFSYSLLLEDNNVIVRLKNDSLIVTTKQFTPWNLQLLSVSSYDEFAANIATHLPSLLTFLMYGLLFAFFSSLLIARLQSTPIIEMKRVMNQIKEGSLSVRLVPKSKDEFGELGLTLNALLDRIQNLMKAQKQHQQWKRRMELKIVQEQVKPHFLYNVLEIINSMIRCSLNEEAANTVEQLAHFYRISLSNGSDTISIAQEIQLIENYLSLQKTRYLEFMDYILALSPAIYDYCIPKLTLQPLIENSIYHGIKEKESGGLLCISGYLENQHVTFEVFDTGKGMSEAQISELTAFIYKPPNEQDMNPHFGLASIVRRLNILYQNEVSFHIDSIENEYTCITISFPALKIQDLGGELC
jgi:Predicted signal transduction protein with a C-terminal ATPase domain